MKKFLGTSKIDSANKKLDDVMEVEGISNETMKSMIGKEVDKKLNKEKAKEKKEKEKIFGQQQNPFSGLPKNWSEWLKRHQRRWKRKTVFIKEEVEERFFQQERGLPESPPSSLPSDYHH